MVGLFSRIDKDPRKKNNVQKLKEIRSLVRDKKYDEALKIGIKYLQKVPHNHDVLFIVGGIYYMKNKYSISISYCDKILDIATYDVPVLLLKAYSHQKLGENKRAIQCCEKIREIDPKNKTVSELMRQLDS
ncbi:MAG: hypothetical protein OEL56_03735 [Nitrosopumilus sp.]|nr:hypothetical protein [Nitrosopumilus sp.]MDH3489538.1 hypothetical protein [Nitrosopumilus sp.]MDH3516536.1 hypothetical protein [Nitrosopumilus sp.]MDH3565002.1 hypothetical protein [Nitrosopumilus sp.]MDH5416425.1 hypothetical protein [Nitrosopumilus sp.]